MVNMMKLSELLKAAVSPTRVKPTSKIALAWFMGYLLLVDYFITQQTAMAQ